MDLTLASYISKVENKEIDPVEVANDYMSRAQQENKELNAFVSFDPNSYEKNEGALLQGAPLAIKDNMLLQGRKATSCSKMLENFVAPYTATCVEKLQKA